MSWNTEIAPRSDRDRPIELAVDEYVERMYPIDPGGYVIQDLSGLMHIAQIYLNAKAGDEKPYILVQIGKDGYKNKVHFKAKDVDLIPPMSYPKFLGTLSDAHCNAHVIDQRAETIKEERRKFDVV